METLGQDLLNLVYQIGMVLLVLAAGAALKYLRDTAIASVGKNKFEQIAKYAEIVVRYAEQILVQYTGEQKYAYVISVLRDFAKSIKLFITEEQLGHFIEASVQQMNELKIDIEAEGDEETVGDA